jgi:hypothetical protein
MTSPPVKYVRQANYTDFTTAHPTDQQSGTSLDADFGAVLTSNNQIIDRLAQIQRADGALANLCVTPDSFSAASLALMAGTGVPRGGWVTATAYVAKDLVSQGGLTYICVTAHTSGVFATDLAAGKWLLFSSGFSPFVLDTVNGLVGINMTPVNVLDIKAIASANTPTIAQIANANAGAAARTDFRAFNGTSTLQLAMLGTGFTPANVLRAGGALINADGPGGLTLNTSANQPVYVGVNSVQVAQFASTGLTVTGSLSATLAGVTGDALSLRGGGAATRMQLTMGRNGADWLVGVAGVNDNYITGVLAGALAFVSNALQLGVSTDNGATLSFLVSGANIFAPTASTTASAANVFMDNAASNAIRRVTSSLIYKTDFQPFDGSYSGAIIDALNPGTYLSLAPDDDPTTRHIGMLAEDVARVAPELVVFIPAANRKGLAPAKQSMAAYLSAHQTADGTVPDSINYDRVPVLILAEVKSLRARLAAAGIP